MTRATLVEIIVILLAVVLGYAGVTLAREQDRPATASPTPEQQAPPTATVAPAVTFTPAPPTPTATMTPTVTPTATPSPTPTATTTPTPARRTYVVQAGDSLSAIAHRFGVPPDAIAQANHLSDPNSLAEGQQLIIPPK
jgi:LysM repeat protein